MTLGLQRLGFSAGTVRAFGGFFECDTAAGCYIFPKMQFDGSPTGRGETLYLDGTRFVPSGFLWSFRPDGDSQVGRVFLFASAADAMAAYEIKKQRFFKSSIFFAIGPSPAYTMVARLKSMFQGGSFFLCFPNNLSGRICDVKVGAFLEGLEISAWMDGRHVVFTFGKKCVSMHTSEVSLSRFEKISGRHLNARTLKAKGFRTFLDQVKTGAGRGGIT